MFLQFVHVKLITSLSLIICSIHPGCIERDSVQSFKMYYYPKTTHSFSHDSYDIASYLFFIHLTKLQQLKAFVLMIDMCWAPSGGFEPFCCDAPLGVTLRPLIEGFVHCGQREAGIKRLWSHEWRYTAYTAILACTGPHRHWSTAECSHEALQLFQYSFFSRHSTKRTVWRNQYKHKHLRVWLLPSICCYCSWALTHTETITSGDGGLQLSHVW